MLLTITYEGPNAANLGYLLHKNPCRPQTFQLQFGCAHVFYPEITENRCTAALLLDIDPIELARKKHGRNNDLFAYVNDRPYVASSFLSTALVTVFGTAMSGRCSEKPELAKAILPLTVNISMLPCRGGEAILHELFEPLGYTVEAQSYLLDEQFPEWGQSCYFTVTLKNKIRICDLLNHLYVLIHVLDDEKHYWVSNEEIEKLLNHGKGWLSSHPKLDLIMKRYLKRDKMLINSALQQLFENCTERSNVSFEKHKNNDLNTLRLEAVMGTLKSVNAKNVIDLGCGEGNLLFLLMRDSYFEKIAGMDISLETLARAKERIGCDRIPDAQKQRISLFQGSLTYRDKRFSGYAAAVATEVIEHLDQDRLQIFEKVLFQYAHPQNIILTTPNREYNINYPFLPENALRHKDHRFEWTRGEFQSWAKQTAVQYGYSVRFCDIGDDNPQTGSPTQMGVFSL